MKKLPVCLLLAVMLPVYTYAGIIFRRGADVRVSLDGDEAPVVHTALQMLTQDFKNVFGSRLVPARSGQIFIGTLGVSPVVEKAVSSASVRRYPEGFVMTVKNDQLYILGSDKRGTAYGILELSRMIGISPWEWWADVPAEKIPVFRLKNGYTRLEYPSVVYRGIFINDEDWGLMPWSSKNFEPGLPTVGKTKGAMGPKTYAKIFELLLRLRANTIWPAMHEVSVPFYLTKGNKEMADKYGILVGTSHCEPLMRNSVTEWDIAGKGPYNYVTNKEALLAYWAERLKELKGADNIYTIGLRGKHDGMMQGVKTLPQHKKVLADVLEDQRELLKAYVNPDLTKVPQLFIPYKEVLDVYNDGLKVPDDVTLIWCDDNYGYIRHFPDEQERARKGGNGVYYHVSYWGRPHDYLWLSTNHPAQLYTQMKRAYNKGARKMWMLNVGDIKPAEYLTELFMDMAWDIGSIGNSAAGLDKHLYAWLSRGFGAAAATALLPVMNEYYRLAYIHKPEFMGGTRTEEKDPAYKMVTDLPWSEAEIRRRIRDYDRIAARVVQLSGKIPAEKRAAWFQLIEYPVRGAAEMNKKFLYGQLARHGKVDWSLSDRAYEIIEKLTRQYNTLNNGKWKGIMTSHPRALPVFEKLTHTGTDAAMVKENRPRFLWNGSAYRSYTGERPVAHGLGYQRGAVSISKGSSVVYDFTSAGSAVTVEVALAPNHPVAGERIRYAIRIDDGPVQEVDYATEGRSEEWKENVLSNQAKRATRHKPVKEGKHLVTIKALDEGVVVDQVRIW
ncbi:glycosyl hydrolase 115 family protein [Niabella aurantiaca]|uniref:glycosyl hydrolase 115 family protein n=1 Tax=Niabella aurantiaca TaxID=379900 RepID=UPI000475963F|nr:glycosyl hydrolase 115 family protein [Niabella aurantiaca]